MDPSQTKRSPRHHVDGLSTLQMTVAFHLCVCHNSEVQIRITRPARKHKIGNQHILEAMRNAGDPVIEGDAMVYIGLDDRGVELEVVAVSDDKHDGGIAVIHAMPTALRRKR